MHKGSKDNKDRKRTTKVMRGTQTRKRKGAGSRRPGKNRQRGAGEKKKMDESEPVKKLKKQSGQ